MNKIFRIVFNTTTGRWVVASEMAKGRVKAGRTVGGSALALSALMLPAGAGAARLTNVDNGVVNTDAVNLYQLKSAIFPLGVTIDVGGDIHLPSYNLTNTNLIGGATGTVFDVVTGFSRVDTALGVLNGRLTTTEGNFSTLQTTVNNINSSGSTTNQNVTALGGRVTTTEGDIANIKTNVSGLTNSVNNLSNSVNSLTNSVNSVTNSVNNITSGGGIKYFHVRSTGADSAATGTDSVAIGGNAKAAGAASIAMGLNATTTTGANNIAIGGDSKSADKAVSIGNGADTSTQAWAVGLGTNAKVTGTLGTALGAAAQVTGDNSAAIGANSLADRANSVSVGKAGSERQITSVAKGTADTDAVNVSQLNTTNQNVTALGGRVTTTEGNITNLTNTVNTITSGGGAKYFHSNSTLADSTATGSNSVAVGGAANATGTSAIAVGSSASAAADWTLAAGNGAAAKSAGDIALGASSQADGAGTYSTALGANAQATAKQATAVGAGAKATHAYSVALGQDSTTDRTNSVSVGNASTQRQVTFVAKGTADTDAANVSQLKGVTTALGGGAGVNADGTIKAPSYTVQGQAGIADLGTALGKLDTATTTNTTNIAGVTGRVTTVEGNVSGLQSTVNTITSGGGVKYFHTNTTLGDSTNTGDDSVAIGGNAASDGKWSLAVGTNSKASGDNSVALGNSSLADRANSVSVGNAGTQRQVINVAKGTVDTDAANVSQLKGVTTALGGGAGVNADGTIKAPSYTVQGQANADIGSALGKLDTATTANATNITNVQNSVNSITSGGGVKYFHVNSTGADSAATGTDSVAIGSNAKAVGASGIALGLNATTTGANNVTIGGNSKAADKAVSIGDSADTSTQAWAVGLGTNAKVTGTLGTALGAAAQVTGDNSAAIGANSLADRANSVSVGKADNLRQITNVAKGTADTDAANVSQVKGVATALGGGAGVNADGTIKAPSYTVQGQAGIADLGTALGKLDTATTANTTNIASVTGRVTTAEGNITNVQNTVNGITSGGGVKYFHTNSTLADSTASGTNATAIGPLATASGADSVVIGHSANTTSSNALVIGPNASVDGSGSVAIGEGSSAFSTGSPQGASVALGAASHALGDYSTSVGSKSQSAGAAASAFGVNANASGQRSVAVGASALGSGSYATAVGTLASADGANASAFGTSANASAANSVALGAGSTTTANLAAAGYNPGSAALSGTASAANGEVSIGKSGSERRLTNLAAGSAATDAVNVSQLQAEDATVDLLGANAAARLGGGATYTATTGAITAPSYALTNANTIGGSTGAATDVGTGFTKVDSALGNLGGRVTTAEGNITNVQNSVNSITSGGGVKYFHVKSTGADSAATGTDSVAIGANAKAVGTSGIALGLNATTTGANNVTIGGNSKAADKSVSIGDGVDTSAQSWAVGLGTNAKVTGTLGVALGAGSQVTGDNAAAIGANSIADRANSVSVGSATTQRQVINVAKGTADTDAANVSQLKGVTTALGGGAGVNADGTIKAPSYTVQGQAGIADLGTALGKLDTATTANTTNIASVTGRVTTAEGNITNVQNTVNTITSGGGVKYFHTNTTLGDSTNTGADSIAIGGGAASDGKWSLAAGTNSKASGDNSVALGNSSLADRANSVSVGKSGSERQITNVAKGTADTDAANVSQLKGVTTALGGGAGVNADGTIKAPSYTVQGQAGIADLGTALGKLDTATTTNATNIAGVTGRVTTVEGNVSTLQTTVNNINSGTVGLVQQSAAGANLTVGKATDGAAVDFTGTAGTRKLTGVSAGTLSATSTDAVNGTQLNATNQNVTTNATNITALGGRVTTAEGNITNLGSQLTTTNTNVTNLTNQINSGTAGLVQQDATTRTITVAKGTNGTLVDLTGTAGTRKLTGVSAGTLSAASTDAVNGSQLNTTNQNVATNATNITALGGRVTTAEGNITNVTGRVTTVEGNVSNLQTTVNNISTGSAGLVKQDATTRTVTVAKDTDGTLVDLTGTAGARKLTGVSAGTLSAASTDAVNGSQLFATNQNVTKNATDITALGGRVTTTEGNVSNLQTTVNNISTGSVGLVKQDATTRTVTVAKDTDGTLVDLTGTAGARKLTGVSAGTLSATSTDAVNGSQLNTTNQNVTALGGRVTTAEGNISNVTGRVTTVEGNVSSLQATVNNLGGGTIGLVKQDATTRTVTVAKDTDGTLVDLTGTAGARKLTGVSAGTLSAASTDAVNGSQLFATNQNVSKNATDITALGGRATAVEGNVSSLQTTVNNISTGSVGLVQQDATTRTVTVAKDTDGTLVDLTGTAGARKLTGVSAGTLSATSTDAVNGSQLNTTNQNVTALGGRVTTAEGNISNIKTDVTNIGGRVTTVEGNISSLQATVNNIGGGTVGLVRQDATTRTVTVAKDTDGTLVDLTGTAGARKLTGVSAGTLSAASTDAVNGSQLFATNQNVTKNATDITALGGRVTTNEGDISTIKTDVAANKGDISTIKTDVAANKGDISTIKTDVAANTGDIATIKTDVAASKGDISNIKTDVTNIGGRVTTVEGNVSNLQTTVNNISTGSVGLVQQDATTRTVTVAKDTDGTLVDLTGTAGARKLTGVSAGTLSATSTDAVNGSQLFTTNQNVTKNATDITALGGRVTTNEGDIATIKTDVAANKGDIATIKTDVAASKGDIATIKTDVAANTGDISTIKTDVAANKGDISNIKTDVTNIGGRVTTVEGSVSNLQTTVNNISTGSVGLVQQDATTRTISVAKDSDGALVNFTGTAGARKLTGVSAGDLSAASLDAVNGSQLFTTNQNVTKNATDITALGGRVTTNEGDISTIKTDVATNKGDISTVKTDVTSIGGRVTTVEGNVSTLAGRVTKNEGDITNLYGQISSGSAGLVKQDATTRTVTVAKDSDGALVNFTGTAGARKLTGVSAGDLSAASLDAVNGSQLFATNQNVTRNTTDITALGGRVTANEGDISTIKTDVANSLGGISNIKTDVTNIGGRVTTVEGNVSNLYTQLNSGSVGLVQQKAAGGNLTVGAGVDGNAIDFANNAGRARKLIRVAAGTSAEDAVDVAQLKSFVADMGGGASIDPITGLVTAPNYTMTNADGSQSQAHTVGDAVTNLDSRVYNLTNQMGSGGAGLVQQAGAGQKLTVGKGADGSEVSFNNAAGDARKLSGVAAGAVSATSTDAVNGSQLHAASQSMTTALGGGSAVNADGTISAPTYTVTNANGTTAKVTGVEGAIGNLDSRVYANTTRIDNVESSISGLSSKIDGAVGLVQQAAPGEQLTVGKTKDGTAVNFNGTAGDRTLTGVAAGKADNDAANIGQLKAAGVIGAKGEVKPVLGYDSADKSSVTLGDAGSAKPVTIHNVASGVSDTDAVNVSQLNARLQAQSSSVLSQANAYADDRFKSALNEIDTLRSDVDDRFHQEDARIDRMGAMSTAMASMTASMSGVYRDNRVGAGAGESNGKVALAVGYQRAFRNSGATLTAGASFTDKDSSVGVGAGFGW